MGNHLFPRAPPAGISVVSDFFFNSFHNNVLMNTVGTSGYTDEKFLLLLSSCALKTTAQNKKGTPTPQLLSLGHLSGLQLTCFSLVTTAQTCKTPPERAEAQAPLKATVAERRSFIRS